MNPVAGELQKLRDNFYRLCAPNPSMMTGSGTNTYLYGKTELSVFDPGPLIEAHVKMILTAQEELQAPIKQIFATHTHADHSPAVSALSEHLPDAQIIGLPADPDQAFEDLTFQPHHRPEDNEVIEVNSGRVRVIYTPGHVGNHICYLLEEHQLLMTGDHLMNGSTVVIIPPKGDMQHYIESLKKLLAYDIQVMAPGHGALMENPLETISWTIKHRLQREHKVIDALNQTPQSLAQLVARVYDDVDTQLHGFAQYSLHAHLIKLACEKKAAGSDGGWVRIM